MVWVACKYPGVERSLVTSNGLYIVGGVAYNRVIFRA
jgi:hypothetical protein